jgi:hypothetical protein
MKQIFLWFGMLLVVAAVSVVAADSPNLKPSEPAPAATNAPSQQVIAYYFHGTVRCETCLKIEQQAKAVIDRQFKTELDAHRLLFKPVNYDLPENAHFLWNYKLPCPSLVLVRQTGGKDDKWTLLGDTWQLVEDPVKFNTYIETEVKRFLNRPHPEKGTNKLQSPASAHAGAATVAQVSNLPYRRLPAGSVWKLPARSIIRSVCGLEIRDTADWKSALRSGAGCCLRAAPFIKSWPVMKTL